jgi:hypothetical protein
MDEIVARSLAKWPNVPAVYGWLELDRRGNWLIRSTRATGRFERIANQALRDFIARNYEPDERGRWFFQNGPQRVYVKLAYTPLVAHYQGERLFDHCQREMEALETFIDDEGSVLIRGGRGIALLDDRDLERYADLADRLPLVRRTEVERRFKFISNPA